VYRITLSGPDTCASEARDRLEAAGFEVLDDRDGGLEQFDGESFLRVASDAPDGPTLLVDSLGWRHRATSGTPRPAMRVVAVPAGLVCGGDGA